MRHKCSCFVLYKTGPMPYVEAMVDDLPNQRKVGRGAVGNPAGRFERFSARAIDDGWQQPQDMRVSPHLREGLGEGCKSTDSWFMEPEEEKIATTLHIDTSRTVINDV